MNNQRPLAPPKIHEMEPNREGGNSKEPPILAIEDEASDAWLLQRAFHRAGLQQKLIVVPDGQDAVAYLSGQGPYTDRTQFPLPKLMLLDLKTPRMNGFELLNWLRSRPELTTLHSVVLSSSTNETDLQRALQLGACEYRVKPHAFADLVKALQEVHTRWLAKT